MVNYFTTQFALQKQTTHQLLLFMETIRTAITIPGNIVSMYVSSMSLCERSTQTEQHYGNRLSSLE